MSDTSQIADMLKVYLVEAVTCCEEVRSISGLGTRLPYHRIAQCLKRNISNSPSSQRLAKLVHFAPLAVRTKKTKPRPAPVRERGWNITKALKKQKQYQIDRPAKAAPFPKDLVRTSPRDHDRVSPSRMERCHHGVPRIQICTICNPDKFREMYGFD